jgi:subtilisin family serine protease
MRRTKAGVLIGGAAVLVAAALPGAGAQTLEGDPPVAITQSTDPVAGQYIVTLADGGPAAETTSAAEQLTDGADGELLYTYTEVLDGFALAVEDESDLDALRNDPRVAAVEENGQTSGDGEVSAPAGTPADGQVSGDAVQDVTPRPCCSEEYWGVDRIDQRELPLDEEREFTGQGAGVDIYMLDTGIVTGHSLFQGRAVAGADASPNGDFNNGIDCHGHGSHTAGTAAGGFGYGVARSANLIGVRVLDCSNSGTFAASVAGLNWVVSNASGPSVVNTSLGATNVSTVQDVAVQATVAAGIPVVLSAGNNNGNACNNTPARTPEALTVGNSNSSDARSPTSNFGPCVDLFAPGNNVWSAQHSNVGNIISFSGTSMAAPHVTGAVAVYLGTHPTATPAQVANAVLGAATPGTLTSIGAGSPNLLLFEGQTFTDVARSSTFWGDIEWMAANGISTGNQPGPTYKPSQAVSRAAMSAFMYRLAGEPAFVDPPTPTFSDVAPTSTFFHEIEWMADEGITTGFAGGLYKPNDPVKRQSMSAFMYRLAGEPAFPDPPTATFNDVATTSTFFTEIEWMADEGITTGFPGNLFKPNDSVTRAAMSAFMHRLDDGPGVDV